MNKEFVLILGPCVIESRDHVLFMAEKLNTIVNNLKKTYPIKFYFKASSDKANRSSINSYRGPGFDSGLKILEEVKKEYSFLITSDVHDVSQINESLSVLDLIQIPAFLSRQTDLIVKATKTGKKLNIKKGQFMSPMDVKNIIQKSNIDNLYITERGTSFGYNNLVVDMSVFPYLKHNYPKLKIIFDATHSVPSVYGTNKRSLVPYLAQSAVASSCLDGLFLEVHNDPDNALCDGLSSYEISKLEKLLSKLLKINYMFEQGYNND